MLMSVLTSVLIFAVVGLGALLTNDSPILPWPPRSTDLNPCDYLLWGYVKYRVYVTLMPRELPQLRQRIMEAVAAIDREILQRVWQEIVYRIGVCRVTKG
jgi:hypothetical protein